MLKQVKQVLLVGVVGTFIVTAIPFSTDEVGESEYLELYESLVHTATFSNLNNAQELGRKINKYSESDNKITSEEFSKIKQFYAKVKDIDF